MSKIPEGWKHVELGDVCKFKGGNAFKESFQGKSSGMYPFIKVSDMNLVGNETTIVNAANWLDEDIRQMIKAFLFPINTTVFAKVGAALLLNRRRLLSRPTIIDNNMMGAIPNASIDFKFLYYILSVIDFSIFVQDGAVPSVNQGQLECLHSLLPPLEEQKKIAEILSSVDRSIEATEKLIGKLSDLKKALMQELFTKGIGHSRFKNSPLGKIPEDWEVVRLRHIANTSYGLGQPPRFVENGVPFIRATDMHEGVINVQSVLYVNLNDIPVTRNVKLKEGDVIVVRSGAYAGDIGYVTKLLELRNSICGYDLKVTPLTCNPKFLCYWLLSEKTQRYHFAQERSRSAQPHLNSEQVENTPVILPSMFEQIKIVTILSANDAKIEKAQKRLEKLKDMKKALMQDLLTGKVRVQTNGG